jgi:hypothetical protein
VRRLEEISDETSARVAASVSRVAIALDCCAVNDKQILIALVLTLPAGCLRRKALLP